MAPRKEPSMKSKAIDYKEERMKAYKRQETADRGKENAREAEQDDFRQEYRLYKTMTARGLKYSPVKVEKDTQAIQEQKAHRQTLVDEANERKLYGPFMRIAHLIQTNPDCAELEILLEKYLPTDESGQVDTHLSYMFEAVLKDSRAYKKRIQRLTDTIRFLLAFSQDETIEKRSSVMFVTLTFRDDVLESTTEETRRRYVARVLSDISPVYVANKDYGGRFGREHYHALIVSKEASEALEKAWIYGFSKFEEIRANHQDVIKVGKYVSKLKNHAVKASTKNEKLIYSRNRPRIVQDGEDYRLNTKNGWLTE